MMKTGRLWIAASLTIAIGTLLAACSTAPKQKDEGVVRADARAAKTWFTPRVSGLDQQIANSGGYVVFPAVGQYGVVIGGGTFGRGVVYDNTGRQTGWAYVNRQSAGLQVGVQGYKSLLVFEDAATMNAFKENKLTGSVQATVVPLEGGGMATAPFTEGAAIYHGDASGLMAGVSVGLAYFRYEPLGS